MKTLAIVIGNTNYQVAPKVKNAISDACAIHEKFLNLGFDSKLFTDINSKDCITVIDFLESEISKYEASVVYYAGHGVECNGENALVAIDGSLYTTNSIAYYEHFAIMVKHFIRIYSMYPEKTNILILDACRSLISSRGIESTGFAPVKAPQGTIIAFSTSSGQSAKDYISYEDEHSPYASAFLQFLGSKNMQIEELFKNVRRCVNAWTGGEQVPWEHTSLIGDFSFNMEVPKYAIQYKEIVVKDALFLEDSYFGNLIARLRHYDWNIQNPALNELLDIEPSQLDKDQLFVFGRNLCQTGGVVRRSVNFFDKLEEGIIRYTYNGENHLLNGILFEMYYNSHGEFRRGRFKTHQKEKILSLRKYETFSPSFNFIRKLLSTEISFPVYIPQKEDTPIDVLIVAEKKKNKLWEAYEEVSYIISSVTINGKEITSHIRNLFIHTQEEFVVAISDFICAPRELIQLHPNVDFNDVNEIRFVNKTTE